MIAENQPASHEQESAITSKQGTETRAENANGVKPTPVAPPTALQSQNSKGGTTKLAETAPAAPAMKDAPSFTEADKKAGLANVSPKPSYAPAPPAEAVTVAPKQQSAEVGGAGYIAGAQKAETLGKNAAADRERDVAKETKRADDGFRGMAQTQQLPINGKAVDEKQKGGPRRNVDNLQMNRVQNENRAEPAKPQSGADTQTASEESETRSVGGRKFRKQGSGAWIDQKYKSSMMLKNVARNSNEFNALDSGLRSIAQQFNGEVIIVWKGKAYKIR